jgi:hypothetical protein
MKITITHNNNNNNKLGEVWICDEQLGSLQELG